MEKKALKRQRTKEEILADKNFITPLFLRGHTGYDIVKELGPLREGYVVTHVMVYNDIKAIVTDWHKQRVHLIDKHLAVELAKVDHLEKIYWDAWYASTGAKKRNTVKQSGRAAAAGKPGQPPALPSVEKVYQETQTTETVGDPRWLQGVQWCMDKRAELLNLKGGRSHMNKETVGDFDEPNQPPVILKQQIIFTTKPRRISNEGITEAEIVQ